MLKILKKIKFDEKENRMSNVGEAENVAKNYKIGKNKNLDYLLLKRFSWMNKFIDTNDVGIEVGSGTGFAKNFILNKNLKLSDLNNHEHLDFKNVDAQNTSFENESFNYVIASNMIHHIPYPIQFFKEMNRILKKNGKLIIFEPYCSITLQISTIIMKHEGFDFTLNVWDEIQPKSNEKDVWAGNIAVPHLIFDNKKKFEENLGNLFKLEYEELTECLIFLNSGGVTSKTFFLPLNNFFLNILNFIDKILIKLLPNIFCLGRRIVLIKK